MMGRVRRSPREAGYTMLEIALVCSFTLVGLAIVVKLMSTTQSLSAETQTHARAASEHRKNLRALSNVLRSIDIRTLKGLESGSSTAVEFQRVSGVDVLDRVYQGAERIEWRSVPRPVEGVKLPGALFLTGANGDRRIAKNVPAGGFRVRQEGKTLAIRLTTYYSTGQGRTTEVSSETAVSLRN